MLTLAKPWPQVREDVPVALTSIGEHAATVAMRAICSCRLYLEVCTLASIYWYQFNRDVEGTRILACAGSPVSCQAVSRCSGPGIGGVLCCGPGRFPWA